MNAKETLVTILRPSTESSPGSVEQGAQVRPPRSAVAAIVSIPRTVVIHHASLQVVGLFPEEHAERRIADEYRRIKRPLIEKIQTMRASNFPGAQFLMVAGALPGDGKTFTSINLALSLARERDFSVLLVDGDVTKRHVSRTLGVDKEPGLMDALLDGSADVETFISRTNIAGLSLLPAGRPHEAATELFTSSRMNAVLARLAGHSPSRIVLFDSAPLLLSSEARALAGVVGQIVVVVHAGITPQNAVRDAIAQIPTDKLAGLILNQSKSSPFDDCYGYGYDYEYGLAQSDHSAREP